MQGIKRKTLLSVDGLLVVVGGSQLDLTLLQQLYDRGAFVVGADGGAKHFNELSIVPAAIIGDMDSLTKRVEWEAKTRVLEIGEQATTDFEKCLYSVEATSTLCLGMDGKRLDHTLAALDILVRYSDVRSMAMVTETDLVLAVRGSFSFEVNPGARVSILPVEAIKFAGSTGLEYPLSGEELAPGKKTGTSNRAVVAQVEINPEQGDNSPYLVIMDKEYVNVWLQGKLN